MITDPPKAPGKPTIIDYDIQSVSLQWEPPTDNGGRPVLGYVVEMKDKFSPDWIEVSVSCLTCNSVDVIY